MKTKIKLEIEDLTRCPKCKSSWVGRAIPVKSREYYSNYPFKFKRQIAVEYGPEHPDHYDGVSEYRCPDCNARFGRWSKTELVNGQHEPPFGITKDNGRTRRL